MSHPDVDTLADFGAEVLDETAAAGVRAHVQECADCRDRLASHDEVGRLLGELPPVQMPDAVAARITSALQAAGAAPTRPLPAPVQPRRGRLRSGTGMAGLAAAAAVVLLVAGVVAGALHWHNGGAKDDQAAGRSANAQNTTAKAPQTYATTFSGRDYTKGSLASVVPSLIGSPAHRETGGTAATARGATAGSAQGSTAGSGGALASSAPSPSSLGMTSDSLATLDPLAHQPAVLYACIAGLTDRPAGSVVPLAVDIAKFEGHPAAVIVLPSPGRPADVEAWVVGPGCGKTPGNDVRFWERVPR